MVKTMANLTRDDIREVIETIKGLYLEDMIPSICGYSGGKDSTAVVQLVWMALSELPADKLKKTVHVISTDTLVESPVVALWATEYFEKNERTGQGGRIADYSAQAYTHYHEYVLGKFDWKRVPSIPEEIFVGVQID